MQPLPHHYHVEARAQTNDAVTLSATGLPDIATAPPREFDGPGDHWSPEALLLAAVADCFVLSFRAVAAASKFEWISLTCETTGTLDRIDRQTRFTEILNKATLTVPTGSDENRAEALLTKAESICLVSNSLKVEVELKTSIRAATNTA